MSKIFNGFKEKSTILIAPTVVGLLLLCTYLAHGVYPFGNETISYYDMSQSFVPLYYHTWDVLHGVKNIFFEWNAGMGCSLADVSGAFLFFPSNLFFLFVKRDNILYAMSVFLLLKMMFSAFSMSYYVRSKCDRKLLVVYAGIAYATCGYILQYYTNIYYLDTVMLFPLFVLALERLIKEKKQLSYIVILFLILLTNQQMAFMVVVFVVLKGWLVIKQIGEEKRGQAVVSIITCSIIAVLISAFSFLPSVICMLQSSRFNNATSNGLIDVLMSLGCEFPQQKYFMLYGGEIGIGCFLFTLLGGRKKIKEHSDSILMVVLLALPIALENIDLLWHGTSYMHFPMRFGYMLSFELIALSVSVFSDDSFEDVENDSERKNKLRNYSLLGGVVLVPLISVILYVLCSQFRQHGIRELSAYKGYGYALVLVVVFSLLVVFSNKRKLKESLILIMTIIQAAIGMYGLVAPIGDFSLECGDGFVISANEVYGNIISEDATNRIKDRNIDLNSNYGFIVNQSSLGCWMNGASPYIQNEMINMGYTTNYTRILDNSGTAFTDAMLGVRRLYSKTDDVNSDLYTDGYSVNDGYVYNCKYVLPFGYVVSEVKSGNGFEYQNALFTAVTGIENRLIEEVDSLSQAEKSIFDAENGVNLFDTKLNVQEKSVLYVYVDYDSDNINKYAFAINDVQVPMDAQGSEGNIMYAQFFINGMIEMGTYEDETVDLKILTEHDSLEHIHVGLMDLNELEDGIEKVNEHNNSIASVDKGVLSMNFETDLSGTLFIPIGFYENYLVTVDGQKSEYFPVMGNAFVGLTVGSGKHIIEIEYIPKGLKLGCVLSLLGIGLGITFILVGRKIKLRETVCGVFYFLYRMVFGATLIILYFVPILAAIIKVFVVLMMYYQ